MSQFKLLKEEILKTQKQKAHAPINTKEHMAQKMKNSCCKLFTIIFFGAINMGSSLTNSFQDSTSKNTWIVE
jgi:hypothetical protein